MTDQTTLVFLHVPKTAGQTIHHQIASRLPADTISPIRNHLQAQGHSQLPQGYRFHSGHIDWTDLESLPADRFTFTVLRDPRERLASFYFFLRDRAAKAPESDLHSGAQPDLQAILERSTDDYFFGGDVQWQHFINLHYRNFFCSYFATRQMLGYTSLKDVPKTDILARARQGLSQMDGIYWTDGLHHLERDLRQRAGLRLNLLRHHANTGPLPQDRLRWPALMERFERDNSRRQVEDFVALDQELLAAIPRPAPPPRWRIWRDQVLANMSR